MATLDTQRDLLDALIRMGSSGRAEGEDRALFPRTYYPVSEHLRAFDPDVVLVVGPRGAGKTELFRAVIDIGLLPTIAPRITSLRLPPLDPRRTRWTAAYPIGPGFPNTLGLKQFIKADRAITTPVEFWFAYLVRVLADQLENTKGLAGLLRPPGAEASAVIKAFRGAGNAPLVALDQFDALLSKEDRHVFVAYDELDTLGGGDWETVNVAVRGLVSFWSNHTRRWRRLRAKIFLRTDLYDRASTAGGADLAKLAANRAEISWSNRNLYAMLIKRIANADDTLLEYASSKIPFETDTTLGSIPKLDRPDDARPLIEAMIGPYMGANERKGLTFRWLLDHIRDGRSQALPRPLVRLIEAAAELQKNAASHPRWPRLIEPRALRRALDKVSQEHVTQSLDEWPWLAGLRSRLKDDREVPWERRRIEQVFVQTWTHPWGQDKAVRPPAADPRELLDYLVEVGVFRARPDGRIDVPDLYLAGLGLKRKGGVVRR